MPARKLVEDGYLKLGDMIYDWGCGKGKDLEYFREQGFPCGGYDIVHRPYPDPFDTEITYDWVTCTYVLNVIPERTRLITANLIFHFLPEHGQAMFTVRSEKDISREIKDTWTTKYDGWLTSIGTFQKGFTGEELANLLEYSGFKRTKIVWQDPVIVIASVDY